MHARTHAQLHTCLAVVEQREVPQRRHLIQEAPEGAWPLWEVHLQHSDDTLTTAPMTSTVQDMYLAASVVMATALALSLGEFR